MALWHLKTGSRQRWVLNARIVVLLLIPLLFMWRTQALASGPSLGNTSPKWIYDISGAIVGYVDPNQSGQVIPMYDSNGNYQGYSLKNESTGKEPDQMVPERDETPDYDFTGSTSFDGD